MAKRIWTEEQRKRQAEKIHEWQPWTNSTGPRSQNGKVICSRNAFKNSLSQRVKEPHKGVVQLKRNWVQIKLQYPDIEKCIKKMNDGW